MKIKWFSIFCSYLYTFYTQILLNHKFDHSCRGGAESIRTATVCFSTLPLFIMLVFCIFTLMLLSVYYTCFLFPQSPQLALLMDLLPFFFLIALCRGEHASFILDMWGFFVTYCRFITLITRPAVCKCSRKTFFFYILCILFYSANIISRLFEKVHSTLQQSLPKTTPGAFNVKLFTSHSFRRSLHLSCN